MFRIKIIIFLLSSLSLTATVWERLDGPYDYTIIQQPFIFKNQLYVSASLINANYKLEETKWAYTNIGLPTQETILFFKQKDDIAIYSTTIETYVTTDGGLHWNKTKDKLYNDYIGRIRQAVITENKIYVNLEFGVPRKLYAYDLSKDEWEKVETIDGKEVLSDYLSESGNYILSGSFGTSPSQNIIKGLFISNDKGNNWKKISTIDVGVSSVILHKGIIFVGGRDQLLYRSSDYGDTWSVDSNKVFPVDLFFSDGNDLYATINSVGLRSGIDVGVHISTDNGKTWKKRHNGIWTTNVRRLFLFDDKLYCFDDSGHLFQTTNKGIDWTICPIMTDSLYSYDLYSNRDTLLVATSGRRGLFWTTTDGNDWNVLGKGFYKRTWRIYKNNKYYILVKEGERGLMISTDYGENWKSNDVGIFSTQSFLKDVELLGGDTLMVATIFGLRYSTDYGENWFKFHTAELDTDIYAQNILRLDGNKLLLVVLNKGLYKSLDNGQTWQKVQTDFSTVSTTRFKTFEYLNNKVFALLPNNGLFFSEDEGITWNEYNPEMSKAGNDNGLLYYNGNIILSIEDGVIISSDNGKTSIYQEIEEFTKDSSSSTFVYDIAIHGNYIYAASEIGIWRAKLSDLGITPTSVEVQTKRNYLYTFPPYPNPAKSEVKVLFYWDINLPMTADDISIYNLDGKKVNTQGNIRLDKQANHYGNFVWDCSTADAGIYLISIKHGTEERTVKVVVE